MRKYTWKNRKIILEEMDKAYLYAETNSRVNDKDCKRRTDSNCNNVVCDQIDARCK